MIEMGFVIFASRSSGLIATWSGRPDSHGVPSGGAGSKFNPTFLRKTNVASAVCLTGHNK
jgi:hypothetical protein